MYQEPNVTFSAAFSRSSQLSTISLKFAGRSVAVDDPALVRNRERFGNLFEKPRAIAHWQRPPSQARGEILSLQPLHGEESLAIRAPAMSNVADDAWVAKLSEKLRLAEKAIHFVRAARAFVQKLERDGVATVAIGGTVDSAHPTAARSALDLKAIGKQGARRQL